MILPRFVSLGFADFQIEKGDLLCLTDIHITSITLRENVFNYEKDYNIAHVGNMQYRNVCPG